MFFYLWKNGRITGDSRLNDVNRDIVDLYNVIKENLSGLIEELEVLKMRKDEESFYKFRDEFNVLKNEGKWTPEKKIRKTALLLYLNKTCFNGLYRENSKSEFNVPYGRYANPKIFDIRNLKKVSISLKDARAGIIQRHAMGLKKKILSTLIRHTCQSQRLQILPATMHLIFFSKTSKNWPTCINA